eukprot:s611_g17.t1
MFCSGLGKRDQLVKMQQKELIADLQAKLAEKEDENRSLTQQIKIIDQEDSSLAGQLKGAKKEIAALAKKNRTMEQANSSLRDKMKEKDSRSLKQQIQENAVLKRQNASLTEQMRILGQKNTSLENEAEAAKNRCAFLEHVLETAGRVQRMVAEALRKKRQENAKLKGRYQRMVQENNRLKDNIDTVEQENESLKHFQQDLASSRDDLQRNEQEIALLTDQRNVLQARSDQLAACILGLEQEKASLEQRLDAQVDGATWQFQGDSGEWISFPARANKELMGKFRQNDFCHIIIDGKPYSVDFKARSQMNQNTGKRRAIRCLFDLPRHWNMTEEEGLTFLKGTGPGPVSFFGMFAGPGPNLAQLMQKVNDCNLLVRLQMVLNQSLSRHDGAICTCIHGSSNFVVKEAFQIRNPHLWRRYRRFVRSTQDKHKQHGISPDTISPSLCNVLTDFGDEIEVDQAGNERLLLHGTKTFDIAKIIATEGFDNRVCRDGFYGKGTYFAAQSCKSAQYATDCGFHQKASHHLLGTILLARVAIGDPFYAQGLCQDCSRPPEKNGVRADSIIARPGIPNGLAGAVQSHMEVVTFDPAQVYPEFILRFTEE